MDRLPHTGESARMNLDCYDKHVAAEMQRDMGAYSLGALQRDMVAH